MIVSKVIQEILYDEKASSSADKTSHWLMEHHLKKKKNDEEYAIEAREN